MLTLLLFGAGEKWIWHQKEDVKGKWGWGMGTVGESCTFRARCQEGRPTPPQHHLLGPRLLLSSCPQSHFLSMPFEFLSRITWKLSVPHCLSLQPPPVENTSQPSRLTLPVIRYLLAHGTSIIQSSGHEELWKISLFLFLLIFYRGKFQRHKKRRQKTKMNPSHRQPASNILFCMSVIECHSPNPVHRHYNTWSFIDKYCTVFL